MGLGNIALIPAPRSSAAPMEIWSWDGHELCFQKAPLNIQQVEQLASGQPCRARGGGYFDYLYAMHVVNDGDTNQNPVNIIFTLEMQRTDFYTKDAIDNLKALGGLQPMICCFIPGQHLNFGSYQGVLEPEPVRDAFFKVVGEYLKLAGSPTFEETLPPSYVLQPAN